MVALDNKNGVIFIPLALLKEINGNYVKQFASERGQRSILYYMLANFPSPISERVEVLEKAHFFPMSYKGFF